jgi:FtsP/CotA-like multicopper oxidase with cupredoxin domain
MKTIGYAMLAIIMMMAGSTALCQSDNKGPVTLPKIVDDDHKVQMASLTVTVPNVVGKTLADATAALKAVGLTTTVGKKGGNNVVAQAPAGTTRVTKGTTVTLDFAASMPRVNIRH